jgi:hypothetical protein
MWPVLSEDIEQWYHHCIPIGLMHLPDGICSFQGFGGFLLVCFFSRVWKAYTVQKGFNLPVDLKYFPLRRAVCILPSCVIFCTVYNKEVCFSFTKCLNPASFLPSVI